MAAEATTRPEARSDIHVQDIGEEVMLYDSAGEKIHVLNHSAYAIWKMCDGKHTLEQLRDVLVRKYPDAGEELADDIRKTIDDFTIKGLLI